MDDHISISQLNEWLGCQQQYAFHRIENLPPIDLSGAMIFGSAVHTAIEAYYKGKILARNVSAEEMTHVFELYVHDVEQESIINWKSTKEAELEKARKIFEVFLEGQSQNRPIEVEKIIRLDIEGLEVPLIGRIDLLEEDPYSGEIIIVDFKTAAAKPSLNGGEVINDIDGNDQLTAYGMWAQKEFPDRMIGMRLDFLIKTKEPTYIKIKTSRSMAQESALAESLRRTWNQITMARAGVISPVAVRSFRCSGCGYRNICPAQLGQIAA